MNKQFSPSEHPACAETYFNPDGSVKKVSVAIFAGTGTLYDVELSELPGIIRALSAILDRYGYPVRPEFCGPSAEFCEWAISAFHARLGEAVERGVLYESYCKAVKEPSDRVEFLRQLRAWGEASELSVTTEKTGGQEYVTVSEPPAKTE